MLKSKKGGLEYPEDEIEGLWFGDVIRPTNEHPGEGYKAVAQCYSYWPSTPIACADEECQAFRDEVVCRTLERAQRPDGTCFESFRRIRVFATR